MLNDIQTEVLYLNRAGTYENALVLIQYSVMTEEPPEGDVLRERLAAMLGWMPEETMLEACFQDAPRNYDKDGKKAAIYILEDGRPHGFRRIRL